MSADAGRLRFNDALRVTSVGLRARPLRAALSALGIAIGTAAIVAVLGLSSSSQAGLLAEIDRLGTNLLTLEAGQSVTGEPSKLPLEAPARITHLGDVGLPAHTALLKGKSVYRSRLIPATDTGGLQVRATSLNLLSALNTGLARGVWLNPGTARVPVAVLGSVAAQRLGIDRIFPDRHWSTASSRFPKDRGSVGCWTRRSSRSTASIAEGVATAELRRPGGPATAAARPRAMAPRAAGRRDDAHPGAQQSPAGSRSRRLPRSTGARESPARR